MPDWIVKYWVEWLFGIIMAAFGLALKLISKKLKHAQAENEALKEGMKAILRDRLTQSHDYYIEKGECPLHALDNMMSMYNAYHTLGGNGAVTQMMEEIRKLPTGTNNRIN